MQGDEGGPPPLARDQTTYKARHGLESRERPAGQADACTGGDPGRGGGVECGPASTAGAAQPDRGRKGEERGGGAAGSGPTPTAFLPKARSGRPPRHVKRWVSRKGRRGRRAP